MKRAPPAEPKDRRDERLAAALRENLKRRKAQARAKDKQGNAGDPVVEPAGKR